MATPNDCLPHFPPAGRLLHLSAELRFLEGCLLECERHRHPVAHDPQRACPQLAGGQVPPDLISPSTSGEEPE